MAPNTAIAGTAPRPVSPLNIHLEIRIIPYCADVIYLEMPLLPDIYLGKLLNVHLYAKVACLQSFMHLAHRQFPPRLADAEMRAGRLWCSRSLWDSSPGPIWTQKAKWWGHLHLCSDNCSFAHYGAFWSFVAVFEIWPPENIPLCISAVKFLGHTLYYRAHNYVSLKKQAYWALLNL